MPKKSKKSTHRLLKNTATTATETTLSQQQQQQQQQQPSILKCKIFNSNITLIFLLIVTGLETRRTFFASTPPPPTGQQDASHSSSSVVSHKKKNITTNTTHVTTTVVQEQSSTTPKDNDQTINDAAAALNKPTKSVTSAANLPASVDSSQVKIPERLRIAMEDAYNFDRNILFLHVGKAGGMAIRENLAANCYSHFPDVDTPLRTREQNRQRREDCVLKFNTPDQKLAPQTRHIMHMQVDSTLIEEATSFLINLRNPIDRIISSYRYTHPGNCRTRELPEAPPNHGCYQLRGTHNMEPGKIGYKIYVECFPNPAMEEFAQATLPPYNTIPDHWHNFTQQQMEDCRYMARTSVLGGPNNGMGGLDQHMRANYKYYAEPSFLKYPNKELFAVRMDHQLEDMVALDVAMGGSGKFVKPNNHYSHGSEYYHPSPLSQEAYSKLCCVLEAEIKVYFDIFGKALNLDSQARSEELQSLRRKCGIPSNQPMLEWRTKCQERMATTAS